MIFNDLNKLSEVIKKERSKWKTVIWTNGCFDIMHPGHMATFKKCRELADIVVVWMNWDLSPYWKSKQWRPINNEFFRAEMLDNLKNVDYIYIFNDETPVEPVSVLKPDYVLKWWDYIQESIRNIVSLENWVIDLTNAYRKMINDGIEKYEKEKWFMPEWVINIKNWWKVVIVPIVEWYSTTNIVNKIKSYKS